MGAGSVPHRIRGTQLHRSDTDLTRVRHSMRAPRSRGVAGPVAPPLLCRAMASRRHGSSRGATLLDALIAASIMVVLYAVGVPNLSRLRSPYTLTGATRQIAADLQAARQRAIARSVSYRVNFDTQNGWYTIERAQAGSWVAESAPQPLPSGARLGTVLPGNPVFDPRGMLGAEVTVPVTVSGSGTRTVTINVLGKTKIT